MFKKKIFWIIYVIIAICLIFFLMKYFPKVMSFINIDIQMNRKEALEKAKKISKTYRLADADFEQAVVFSNNSMAQFYVELEAGGKERFNQLLENKKYSNYYWKVRFFQEKNPQEAIVWFKPDGEFYGFRKILSDKTSGNNLGVKTALKIAEDFCINEQNIDLTEYEIQDKRKNQVESGRIDHTFVYKYKNLKLNDAYLRLFITVSGDQVSQFRHRMKIPEGFYRRYQSMRSKNNLIAMIGQIAMALLYGLGGIIALFLLIRNKEIIWKQPLIWAGIISVFMILSRMNYFPLYWMGYDTSVARSSFIIQSIIQNILFQLGDFVIVAFTFIVAEGLTRKAFPRKIQFWKIWSKDVANSKRVIGNSIAPYILPIYSLAFLTVFYFITTKYFGWWNPSSLPTSPNTLATPFPWLSAIGMALHAGFWEEALFRAIPLAGAVLIGKKFGKEKLFLIIAVFLQAIIFGMGHANYAAQPAYARVIELIIPSLIFAFLYLRFGLLIAVIMHFAFDAILMSMPIWVANSSNLIVDKILFLLFFFIPLIVIAIRYMQSGQITKVSKKYLNKFYITKKTVTKKVEKTFAKSEFKELAWVWIVVFSVLGIGLWINFTDFSPNTAPLKISREKAVEIAKNEIAAYNINLNDNWKIQTLPFYDNSKSDRFVLQTSGKEVYQNLYNEFLKPPLWKVKFSKFEVEVAQREKYEFGIDGQGSIFYFQHKIPENQSGAELSEAEARAMALNQLKEFYQIESGSIKEISLTPSQKPNRKDWEFTFEVKEDEVLEEGNLRYRVYLAGKQVMATEKYVHITEDWSRKTNSLKVPADTVKSLLNYGRIIFYLAGIVAAIIFMANNYFKKKEFMIIFAILFVLQLVKFLLKWHNYTFYFEISKPWSDMVSMLFFSKFIQIIFISLAFSTIIQLVNSWFNRDKQDAKIYKSAIGLGLLALGLLALTHFPEYQVYKPSVEVYGALIPILGSIFNHVFKFIGYVIHALLVFGLVRKITADWHEKKFIGFILIFLYSLILFGSNYLYLMKSNFILAVMINSLIVALVAALYVKKIVIHSIFSLPIIIAVLYSGHLLANGLMGTYDNVLLNNIVAVIFILLMGWNWHKIFRVRS